MKTFLLNITLAFLWAMLNGTITLGSLLVGFAVGYAALGLLTLEKGRSSYFRKVSQATRFLVFFLKEMIVSSLRVAWDIITPTYYMKPGIIGVPIRAETDAEIALLANVISLTPGTLSLDVSPDRKTIYIHAMFIDDPDGLRREIQEGLERRLLEVMR